MTPHTNNQTDALAYSVEAAAEVVDVGRTYLYGEIKAGRLRSVKKGRRRLVRPQDLSAWLDASDPESS